MCTIQSYSTVIPASIRAAWASYALLNIHRAMALPDSTWAMIRE
jgi:hypothetical protein